jgi:ribosome biogenesis GTPase
LTADFDEVLSQLVDLGWDDARTKELSELDLGVVSVGRVSRVDRGLCTVLMPSPGRASYQAQRVATGDWVVVSPGSDHQKPPHVAAILPRHSAFTRRRAGPATEEQVVAANVDVVLLVQALDRDLNAHSLQRYLTLAWDSGAEPVVVLSKSDCCSRVELANAVRLTTDLATPAPVLTVSTRGGDGVAELTESYLRPGRTLALVGPSGAGKSTLVNAIVGSAAMATAEVRSDGKGRHTTTHRELVVMPGRGILLDTPGMRAVGLWAQSDGLELAFSDLEQLADGCRFRDCSHTSEPGCALSAAIASGTITADRLASWRKLQAEQLSVLARQGDMAVQRQQKQRWKALTREQRRH